MRAVLPMKSQSYDNHSPHYNSTTINPTMSALRRSASLPNLNDWENIWASTWEDAIFYWPSMEYHFTSYNNNKFYAKMWFGVQKILKMRPGKELDIYKWHIEPEYEMWDDDAIDAEKE